MQKPRPALFRGRHFEDQIIILCVRWYLRYCLTYRDLEELMAERGLSVDHSTIARLVLRYAPELNKRIRGDTRLPNRSWRVDETYVLRRRQVDLFVSGRRFFWRHHLFHALAEAGCGGGQALSAASVVALTAHPAACDQRGRTPSLSSSHSSTEGKR
jgi:hypothetical protein